METAPQTKSSSTGPARVCCNRHALVSSAAEVKAPGLCETYDWGSKEGTEVKTRGFLFLGRGRLLLQVSEGRAGTVWLPRCRGHQPTTRLHESAFSLVEASPRLAPFPLQRTDAGSLCAHRGGDVQSRHRQQLSQFAETFLPF